MQTYSHMPSCPRTGRRHWMSSADKGTPTSSVNLRGSLVKAIDANLWSRPREIFLFLCSQQDGAEIETAEENEMISAARSPLCNCEEQGVH